MKFFRNHPFVKLLSFQLAGICIANFLTAAGELFSVLLLILALWTIKLIRQKEYPFDAVHSAMLSVLITMISCINARDHQYPRFKTNYGLKYFEAQVLDKPAEKANSFQTVIKELFPVRNQKMIVYLEKDEKAQKLRAGDMIFAKAIVSEIKNSCNPFEFNYRNYMSGKHIWHNTYIASGNYIVNKDDNPSIFMSIDRFQGKLVSELKKKLSNDQAFQIVSALALGYRDELTRETRSYFISTGAMHILSVSGLHVAMIFLFLNVLFSFLKKSRAGKILYFFIMASCLWGYALLTGFSPPVQRAAVMFSFILIGNSLNRPASIYNSIAASAFFLLLFNPDLFFDIGFQLSYMAVISIVFFYPKLTQLLKSENRVLKWTWQLCCVSLAAQIGTFPLSVYYFSQFPVYFWLSNFVVVPAGYLILGSTAAFFAFSHFDNVTSLIAQILCITADMTLDLLKKIGELPFAVIDGLSICLVQFICLLLVLGLSMFFIVSKKHAFFFAGLSFLLLFLGSGLTQKITLFDQRKVIVYQTEGRLIHLINGRTNYLITDSKNPPDPVLYKNVLLNLKLKNPLIIHTKFADEKKYRDLIIWHQVIQFTDKSLIIEQGKQIETSPDNSVIFSHGLLDLNRTDRHKIRLQPD